jgi:hypothetical protein
MALRPCRPSLVQGSRPATPRCVFASILSGQVKSETESATG